MIEPLRTLKPQSSQNRLAPPGANGGKTSLDNLVLLCRRHHRCVHEEGYRVERSSDGDLRFFRPRGWEIPFVPPPPRLFRDPLEELSTLLDEEGVSIDSKTGFPRWDGGRLDLALAIDGMWHIGKSALPGRHGVVHTGSGRFSS